jgi:hypothetical protein
MKDMTGKRFGRLIVKNSAGIDRRGQYAWECQCDCGEVITVGGSHLRTNHTNSCGCIRIETISKNARTHGLSKTKTYKLWANMVQRCTNPENNSFKHYGGRGIAVCERWMEFDNFITDMGHPTKGMTLDRRDNNGNYEPANCRWASVKEQQNNKRSNHIVTYNGKQMTLAQVADAAGIPYPRLRSRLCVHNLPIEVAAISERYHYKLTKEKAEEIRASLEANSVLAARYSVTQRTIRAIKQGRTWK